MGIKAGSGKGAGDAGGTRGKAFGGGVGSSSKRDKRPPFSPPPPKKPLRPIENPFPEKKEFRLGHYRILEERDDYLLCTGYDPNAKNPFSEVTPSAFRTGVLMKVAKPPLLQRTAVEAGGPVTIDGIAYTYTYSDAEYGVRTATWTDGGAQEEEQRIYMPYLVGDLLVAVEIRKNAAVDGMEVTDEEGTRLRWMDLNVSGRHWKSPAGSAGPIALSSYFTLIEYDPLTGDIIQSFDRGRARSDTPSPLQDTGVLIASDGAMYACGRGHINRNFGCLVKWDADTGERVWDSDAGVNSGPIFSSAVLNNNSNHICEASDGYIWVAGIVDTNFRVGRFDPDTGDQTHMYTPANNVGSVRALAGGAVLLQSTASSIFRRLDNTATSTHTWTVGTVASHEVYDSLSRIVAARSTAMLEIFSGADLSSLDSRAAPGAEVYTAVTTDGTTVWTTTSGGANPMYRAYDATNLATELWNAVRDASFESATPTRLIYKNSALYSFGVHVRKLDPTDGSETWETPTETVTLLSQGAAARAYQCCGVGSTFVVNATGEANRQLFCYSDTDGSLLWHDALEDNVTSVFVTDDDRLFVTCSRTS